MLIPSMILFVAAGFIAGRLGYVSDSFMLAVDNLPFWCLCGMLFITGYGMRTPGKTSIFKNSGILPVIITLSTIAGTFTGASLACLFIPFSLPDTLAVSAGFGWYSYAGVYITKIHSVELGAVAFMSNLFRELLALLTVPVVIKYLRPECSISFAGATSMDVVLPMVVKYSSEQYAVVAFVHGAVISVIVPLAVSVFLASSQV